MGRIKTKKLKRKTVEVMKQFGDQMSTNFEDNKKHINTFTTVTSKKLRNVIAGYATRLAKKREVL